MIGAKGEASRSTTSTSTRSLPFSLLDDSSDFAFKRGREPSDQAPPRPSPTTSVQAPPRSSLIGDNTASGQRVREQMIEAPGQPAVRVSDNAQSPSRGAVETTTSPPPEKAVVSVPPKRRTRRFVVLPAAEDETVAYVAVTRGSTCKQMLHRAKESGYPIILPMKVERAPDRHITLKVLTFSETFTYDSRAGSWIGKEGSTLVGGSDLFEQTSGWTMMVKFHNGEVRSASISHYGEYQQGTLAGLRLEH
jgi:hypothetical protein